MAVTRSAARAKDHQDDGGNDISNNSIESNGRQTLTDQQDSQEGNNMAARRLPKTIKESKLLKDGVELDSHLRTRTALMLLILIFSTSLVALGFVYLSFPHLEP